MWAPNLAYSRQLKQNNSLIHSLPQRAKPTTMKAWIIFKQNETMFLSFFSRFYIWFQWKYWQINPLFMLFFLCFTMWYLTIRNLFTFHLIYVEAYVQVLADCVPLFFSLKVTFVWCSSPLMHLLLWDSNKVSTFLLLGWSKLSSNQVENVGIYNAKIQDSCKIKELVKTWFIYFYFFF